MNEYDPSTMMYEDEKYFLGSYYHYDPSSPDRYSLRILDFKEGKSVAVEYFKHAVLQAFPLIEVELLEDASFWYLVAMPPHEAGKQNGPCEDLCITLANQFSWLQTLSEVLQRTETVPKAATAAKENRPRPDTETHKRTIRYFGPQIKRESYGILLIDDIFTNGRMFRACSDIISAATHCRHMKGFFLGKTVK